MGMLSFRHEREKDEAARKAATKAQDVEKPEEVIEKPKRKRPKKVTAPAGKAE